MKHTAPSARRRRIASVVAAAAAVAIGLAGCAAPSTDDAGSGGDLTPVNYQLSWLKITQFGGFFAGEAEGFYEEEGIAPTFTAGGANILAWQQVTGGAALLGDEDNTLLLQAIESGEDLVALGAVFQKSPMAIMSLSEDPLLEPSDFEGKTLAFPDNGIEQYTAVLESQGVDMSTVTVVPAGADPTQLVTGQVDGYAGYATAQGAALELQGLDVEYLYFEDLGIPSYGNVIITTKTNLEENRDLIVKFLRATVKGYEWMNANPEDGAALVVNEVNPTGGLDLETETAAAGIQADLIAGENGVLRLDVDKFQTIIDSLVEAGTLSAPLDAADVVDTSVLDEVFGDKTALLR
ncbi:NitT/TauT family transport system substrate-binding protein [Microbacteriaceae bacterium SG_E_30_P1]|uniref:Thiamine pyrimidine synthase n=1 Tax=Antiquaquibacter oligotrophicus TaxID=2880260 RepID=A0ABT6KM23_9MICO|nr:ABC transporter substrate-binding protein [Antiquaquibacter oligotrophicus]MDH6181064.1 NitT/TauT family transport system substrate-binding protein [Antiquaquibacter oligotrophicus]UDF13238.1 ABC transporter substrate-binding protein [Antiquaquibacter oligotrophicus]